MNKENKNMKVNCELCRLLIVINKFLFSFFFNPNYIIIEIKEIKVKKNIKKISAKFLALC